MTIWPFEHCVPAATLWATEGSPEERHSAKVEDEGQTSVPGVQLMVVEVVEVAAAADEIVVLLLEMMGVLLVVAAEVSVVVVDGSAAAEDVENAEIVVDDAASVTEDDAAAEGDGMSVVVGAADVAGVSVEEVLAIVLDTITVKFQLP